MTAEILQLNECLVFKLIHLTSTQAGEFHQSVLKERNFKYACKK